jgi:hypothetical protein
MIRSQEGNLERKLLGRAAWVKSFGDWCALTMLGSGPTNVSLFFTDDQGHAMRANFTSVREAAEMFSSNTYAFGLKKDQTQKVIVWSEANGEPTGKTALLVHSVVTMTGKEVEEAKSTDLSTCKVALGETWKQWREGRGKHIQVNRMSDGSEANSTAT